MTVSYSKLVATAKFSCFLKLLLRWRGSIYKLLWKDFAVFAVMFYSLSFLYRFALTGIAKQMFVRIVTYCQEFGDLIPISFVLGFYVSLVVSRWWAQFQSIPYPSRMALFVSTLVTGSDDRARLMRRTIMRYLCLTHVMTMSSISPPVKKRFPTFDQMTDAGFLLPSEQKSLEEITTTANKYFIPLVWAASVVCRARKEGRIKDDFAVKTLIDEINEFRGKCGTLFGYDWVTVPLVYTQVVTLAVYMFFLSCLMGRQFLEEHERESSHGDLYFPFFTFLQFFFYMGWLKVAETLLNPFGEDDDDFDVNGMIDSNLKTAYLVVDEMHNHHPELLKDQYWDNLNFEVPYNAASRAYQTDEHIGSAANIEVPAAKAQTFAPVGSITTIAEEGEGYKDGSVHSEDSAVLGRPKRGSKKQKVPPSVTRQASKLSNFFKPGSSARRSSLKKEGIESDADRPKNIKLSVIGDPGKNSSNLKIAISPTSTDDLQFHLSDDESSPQSDRPLSTISEAEKFAAETSPLVPQKGVAPSASRQQSTVSTSSGNVALPSRQQSTVSTSSGNVPLAKQESSGIVPPPVSRQQSTGFGSDSSDAPVVPQDTAGAGPPARQQSSGTTTPTSSKSAPLLSVSQQDSSTSAGAPSTSQSEGEHPHRGGAAGHHLQQQGSLAPLVEAPESMDAFVGLLQEQLKQLREDKPPSKAAK